MGMTPRDLIVLSGAHTLGEAEDQNIFFEDFKVSYKKDDLTRF